MIKLKKIVAVSLAAAMCMGMGITSFADYQESDKSTLVTATRSGLETNNVASDFYYNGANQVLNGGPESINNQGEENKDLKTEALENRAYVRDAQGNIVIDPATGKPKIYAPGKASLDKTLASINTKQEVIDILAANKVIASQFNSAVDLKDIDILPVASADVYALGSDGNYLAFKLGSNVFDASGNDRAGKYVPGDTVLAMVENGSGTGVWRVEAGTVNKDGEVVFETNTTGAIVVIKAMKNGMMVQMTVDEDNNVIDNPIILPTPEDPKPADGNGNSTNASNGQNANGSNTTGTTSTSSLASPRTGEF